MRIPTLLTRFVVLLLLLTFSLPALAEPGPVSGDRAAFLKSLVVPGWGQYSLGRKNAALTFFGAELMLVGGILTLNSYGRSARSDYEALAAGYAGVQGSHGHDFYVDVGNWMTVDQFNQRRLQQRQFDLLYTSPADRWMWDTDAHRARMQMNRIRSDRAFNSVFYLLGGIVINHVASAIHAGRVAATEREKTPATKKTAWNMDIQTVPPASGLAIRFTRSF